MVEFGSYGYHEKDLPDSRLLKGACPECGSDMVLRFGGASGQFYGCSKFPECRATHGAHPNGDPLGIPANDDTKRWRHKAHTAFDQLWEGPDRKMNRDQAYTWMQKAMKMREKEAHIGMFDAKSCRRLLAMLQLEHGLLPKEQV